MDQIIQKDQQNQKRHAMAKESLKEGQCQEVEVCKQDHIHASQRPNYIETW